MWPHEKCGGMTRFLCGDGVRGGLWFVVGAVRGRMGSRLSVVRGGQPPGSGRLAPRCALVGKKGWDARMGLVVPPNRLRAALAARCPSSADGCEMGAVRSGMVRGGSGSMLSVARGGQPPGGGRLAPRFTLVSNKDRGYDGGSSCLRRGEPLRSLSVARRLLMGCEVGVFEAGRSRDWGERSGGRRLTAAGRRGWGR